MPQVLGQVLGGQVALGGALRQGFEANPLQLLGDVLIDLPERAGFIRRDLLQQLGLRFRTKGRPPGQQLVEDHAQAENVASAIHAMPLAAGLLRTHVGRRPGKLWALAEMLFFQRQSEIRDVRLAGGEKKAFESMYRASTPAELVSGMRAVVALPKASPKLVDALWALVDETLMEYFVSKRKEALAAAKSIVALLAESRLKHGRSRRFAEHAAASCIPAAHASMSGA